MRARFILATVDGEAYEIPEMWVAACPSMTVKEALEHCREPYLRGLAHMTEELLKDGPSHVLLLPC